MTDVDREQLKRDCADALEGRSSPELSPPSPSF
jgi:hypothetical protein